MRYILYNPSFTEKNPFFRIGNEGVGLKELLMGFIEAELPDDLTIFRFNNLYVTDLDTFNKFATAAQRKEVEETLKLFNK